MRLTQLNVSILLKREQHFHDHIVSLRSVLLRCLYQAMTKRVEVSIFPLRLWFSDWILKLVWRCAIFLSVMMKYYVSVVRCPPMSPVSDGYYRCHPSSDMVQGTTCHFGCYRGHKLQGHSSLTCEGHIDDTVGRWTSRQPTCESEL